MLLWCCCLVAPLFVAAATAPGNHTNNWVVLVDTSRFWFNYRHAANVFSLYRAVRRLGVPDSRIVMMVADGMACDAQNPYPAQVFNDERRSKNVYGTHIQVDYRGTAVTAEALMRVLTGRHAAGVPASQRLLSDADSNVFLYLTGHGGDEFFKFQDAGEISSYDLADAFHAMHQGGRYRELLVMADTCQANTLQERLYSPNILMVGSSRRGENSWSKGTNAALGTTMVDRFTDATLEFVERHFPAGRSVGGSSEPSMLDLLRSYDPSTLDSHPGWVSRLARPLDQIPVSDFFAARVRRSALPPAPAGPQPANSSCAPGRRTVKRAPPPAALAEDSLLSPSTLRWIVPAVSALVLCSVFIL